MEYGDEFYRKIYVFDPKKGKTETILDDGSYTITKNGELLGQNNSTLPDGNSANTTAAGVSSDLTKHDDYHTTKAEFESNVIYMTRYAVLIIGFLTVLYILLMILLITVYFCIYVIDDVKKRRVFSVEQARRNVTFMRLMNYIPYSQFVISEAKDCPICLQEFTPNCQVV